MRRSASGAFCGREVWGGAGSGEKGEGVWLKGVLGMDAAGGVEAERRVEGRRAERRETVEFGREGGRSGGWVRGVGTCVGWSVGGVAVGIVAGGGWDWDFSWWSWSS